MVEIIPAILAHDEEEFMKKVERVRALGAPLHIDVMDGMFVKNTTWAPADRLRRLLSDVPFEVHLMVSNPEHAVPVWLASGAGKVIFHVEATAKEMLICRATAEECDKLVLAINPDTPVSRITPALDSFRGIMVMGVTPGWSGQPFQTIALEKIKTLKGLRPSLTITVDGGVTAENAAIVALAGADRLVSGSSLTDNPDPADAYVRLKENVNGPTII